VSWPLAEACTRAELRRALCTAGRAPLPAIALVCAWIASVPLAYRAGTGVADGVGPALAELSLARSVVVGLALPAGAAGVVLAMLVPGVTALGAALAAAPVPPYGAQSGLALPRLAGAVVLVGPPLVAALLPLGASAPGGAIAVGALALLLVATAATGALVAEIVLRLHRRPLGVPGIWETALGVAAVAGAIAVAEVAARALAGHRPAIAAVIPCAAGLAVAAGSSWLALAATRPPPHPGRREGSGRRRVLPVVESSALALLSRASDVRTALVAAAAFGLAGVVAGTLAGDAGSGVLLGAGVAALTAGIAPLSSLGRIAGARWAWSAGAASRVAAGWAAMSAAALAAPCVVVVAVGILVQASTAAIAPAVSIVVAAWVAGTVAGSLFERRASALADDTVSLAAFLGVLGFVLAAGGKVHAALTELGLPSAVVSPIWLTVAAAAAAALLWRRVRC
jgi:hypothetical protein